MAVLRQLEEERSLIHETTEHLVDEEDLSDPGFLEQLSGLIKDAHVLFVAVPGAYATHLAVQALRMGVHTFLGRSAAPSIAECKMIAALGEEAGDAARYRHLGSSQPTGSKMTDGGTLTLESGISQDVFQQLEDIGHKVALGECCFGGYQAIWWDAKNKVYHGATEMRKDGIVVGY